MYAVRLAFALIRVPRLFASLFLLPILASLVLVYAQLVVTALGLKALGADSGSVKQYYQDRHDSDLGRRLLFGDKAPKGDLKVCRWEPRQSGAPEAPPSTDCNPDRLDVALQVSDPATYDPRAYVEIFRGLTERLHICKSCQPDAVIKVLPNKTEAHAYSTQALILMRLTAQNEGTQEKFLAAMKSLDHIHELVGDLHFHSAGLRNSLNTSRMETSLALVFNVAALVVIALWLALKAHRRVLDYFARNGALMPMVAATGKGPFYGAIWILTLLRVVAFLGAAVPITYYGFTGLLNQRDLDELFSFGRLEFALWIAALVAGLSLATLVASIADLKHRHHFLSILYRYVPMLICFVGGALWAASFLFDGTAFGIFRGFLTALPLVGTTPILLAPALPPQYSVLVIHLLLTSVLLVWALKRNTRWFAAHLEEL